ncbi:uncharacterized protein [Montipora capricornis]|uniref:uncharacterized protein n=1 Tax=Montipora capricornis TaxID=246305 RepID=UPI0035F1078A
MYHRIRIPEADQHVHRFLWRDLQTDREPDVYVKRVLIFGDKPAPAMAQIALRKTVDEAREDFPEAAQVLKDNTYMDDICDSVCTEEEARELTKCIDNVLETGGFKAKGWLSNKANSNTDQEERKETAILKGVMKKRAKIRPTGAVGKGRRLGREITLRNSRKMDQPVSRNEELQWHKLREMSDTALCSWPPYILCFFSDASEDAFGSCAYARWQMSNGEYDARFIAAKSRVAPLKRLTIPRLELQGAVLASRLCKTIVDESRFQFEKVILFLDSKIVLAWIRSKAMRFKQFVSVRVGEIQTNTDPSQWKHIPGEMNVTDDVSRGISVRNLVER